MHEQISNLKAEQEVLPALSDRITNLQAEIEKAHTELGEVSDALHNLATFVKEKLVS